MHLRAGHHSRRATSCLDQPHQGLQSLDLAHEQQGLGGIYLLPEEELSQARKDRHPSLQPPAAKTLKDMVLLLPSQWLQQTSH